MLTHARTIPRDLLAFAAWRIRGAPLDEATQMARLGLIPILGGAGNIEARYGTSNQAITCTIGNNPTGTVNAHGRISNSVDNSSNLFFDAGLFLKMKTGGSAPTGNKQCVIYALGTVDGGTTYTDGYAIGDADTAVAPNTARPVGVLPLASSGTTYYLGPVSVGAGLLNGVLADHWGVLVWNDSGQTWSTTNADFALFYQGIASQYT